MRLFETYFSSKNFWNLASNVTLIGLFLNFWFRLSQARTYTSFHGKHCLSGAPIYTWNDGKSTKYASTGTSVSSCQSVCDQHSSECIGFDYFHPTQSCLFRRGPLPDTNTGSQFGKFSQGKCSYRKDFHHAILPSGNNENCRTLGKVVEAIARTSRLPNSNCIGQGGVVDVLYTGRVCNTMSGIQWETLRVIGNQNQQLERAECTWKRSQKENKSWQKKWFGGCGDFSDVYTGETLFPKAVSSGFINAHMYGLYNDPAENTFADDGGCPYPLTMEQCHAYAKLNRLNFHVPNISNGLFEYNDNDLVYGCVQDQNDNSVHFNFAKEPTKIMTCRPGKNSRFKCVCHVGIPSSACSTMCPWNNVEKITMNADCGSINLMYNGGNDLAIFNMGASHPNSESSARDICARKCYAKNGDSNPPCSYFKVSPVGGTTEERKCFQEFLNDDCETSNENTASTNFRSYRFVPPTECNSIAVDSVANKLGHRWETFIATQFSYARNKSAWTKVVLSGDAIRCKTPYGHKKSSSSYLNATSLHYNFLGKSMVTCDIIVPNTFSAVKGRIKVQATRSHNYVDETYSKSMWGENYISYGTSYRYGGPCPYKYRHIKQRFDCKTAADSMPGKLWGGEANAFNKIDACFEDEGVIFYNIAGIYRLQKVVNSTMPVGLRVCFRQEHYPTGVAGSFTFGTPGKILNLITQTGLLGAHASQGDFTLEGDTNVSLSNILRLEIVQSSAFNDFIVTFELEVFIPGSYAGKGLVVPPPSHSHSFVVHVSREDYSNNKVRGDVAYLYGGKNENDGVLSKLYILNLDNSSWSIPTVVENGQEPGPLYGHAAAIYKDSMLIYGGCCFYGEALEDLHALNLNSMTWTRPLFDKGDSPGKRYYHTFVIWLDYAYVYGGINTPMPLLVRADPCGRRGKTSQIKKVAILESGHSLLVPFNFASKFGGLETLTFETWIMFNETFTGDSIELLGGATGNNGWFLKRHRNCNMGYCLHLGGTNAYGRIAIELYQWYHLATTLDQDLQLKYYVNGQIDTDVSLDNTCRPAQYVYVEEGLNCPSSYSSINEASGCQIAATSLGKNWGGGSSNSDDIQGCIMRVSSTDAFPSSTGTGDIVYNSPTGTSGNRGMRVCKAKSKLIRAKGERCPISYRHERSGRAVCQAIATELSITFELSKQNLHDHIPGCIYDSANNKILFNEGGVELVDVPSASGAPICTPCIKTFIPDVGDRFLRGVGRSYIYNFRVWRRAVPQAEIQCKSLSRSNELTAAPYGTIFWTRFSDNLKDAISNQKIKGANIYIGNIDIDERDHESLNLLVDKFNNVCLDCSIACPGGASPPCVDHYPWRVGTLTWEDMKTEASIRGGRLPTLTEARALSVDDPQLSNVWIAIQNPLLQEGKDWMQLSRRSPLYPHGSSYVELHDSYPTWGDKSDVVFTPRSKYFSYVRSSSTTPFGSSVHRLELKNLRWKRRRTSKNIPPLQIASIKGGILHIPNTVANYDLGKFAVGDFVRISSATKYGIYSCLAGTKGNYSDGVYTISRAEKFDQETEIQIVEPLLDVFDTGSLELVDAKDGNLLVPGHLHLGSRLVSVTIEYDSGGAAGTKCDSAGQYTMTATADLVTSCRVASNGLQDADCHDGITSENECLSLSDVNNVAACVFTKGSTCRDSNNVEAGGCDDSKTTNNTCLFPCILTSLTKVTLWEHFDDKDTDNHVNDACSVRFHDNNDCAVSRLNMRWKPYKPRQAIKRIENNILSIADVEGYAIGDEVTISRNPDSILDSALTCVAANSLSTYTVVGVIRGRKQSSCRESIGGLQSTICHDGLNQSMCNTPCRYKTTDNALVIDDTNQIANMNVAGTNGRCMVSRYTPSEYMKWEMLEFEDTTGKRTPSRRSGHSMVIDDGKMVIFGGYDGKKHLNDLHVLDVGEQNVKWVPGISSKVQGKYIYIRSERSALLPLLDVKVYDYYGNELTINKNIKHGFDLCPSTFPYAYRAEHNFDRCCDTNTHWGDSAYDQRRRNDECTSFTPCAHKPCVDFTSNPSNNPSTISPWLSIHINGDMLQSQNPLSRIAVYNTLSLNPSNMKLLKNSVLFVTNEDIVEYREPTEYSLKWKLSEDPFQEYVNDDHNGHYEKHFEQVCPNRRLHGGCRSMSAMEAYGDTCPSYPSLKAAFSACLNLPASNSNYCNSLTYSEPSGESCFSYCSDDFSCGEDVTGSTTAWVRRRKKPSPRSNHTAVVQNGLMYVFGGWDGQVIYGDLWQFDITWSSWSKLRNFNLKPSSRFSHASVLLNGRMVLFGGQSSEGAISMPSLQCKEAGYCSPFAIIRSNGIKSATLLYRGPQAFPGPQYPYRTWSEDDNLVQSESETIILHHGYQDGWYTVFSEAPGEGNSDYRLDNTGIRLLKISDSETPPPGECVKNGDYQVRIEWGSDLAKYVQFTVPQGSNIFEQRINQNIDLTGVTSSWSGFGATAKFCHACVENGKRFGGTCWGVIADTDNNRQCGCNGKDWAGSGIYYGGKKRNGSVCAAWGGGFAGEIGNGDQKGGLDSVGVVIKVKCEGYKNVSLPTSFGSLATKCNNGNFLNDGFEYLYNEGRNGTDPGVCGFAEGWCCARKKGTQNEIEIELANEGNMYIFSHASNTNSFGLAPQYRYDSSDDTLYRPTTTSIWKLSTNEHGEAFSFPKYIRLSIEKSYIEGEIMNDSVAFVGIYDGKSGHFRFEENSIFQNDGNLYSFELSLKAKKITIYSNPHHTTLNFYNGQFSFDAAPFEKLENFVLKTDNLIPAPSSQSELQYKVWKSVLWKRKQRRRYKLNTGWKGTFGFSKFPAHMISNCDKCGSTNYLTELKLYSTEGCEVNCHGCISHETCIVCRSGFYLKNGNCFPDDVCPNGVQSFGMPDKMDDVVCLTCSNGLFHCRGMTGYSRPATYLGSFNPFEKETHFFRAKDEMVYASGVNLGSVKAYVNYKVSFSFITYSSKHVDKSELLRFSATEQDCCSFLDKYLSISFVPKANGATYFDSEQNRAIQTRELVLEVTFGTSRDGNMIMEIPNITQNQWNNFDVTVVNNVYTVRFNKYKSTVTTSARYRRPLRNEFLNVKLGQVAKDVRKSKPITLTGPYLHDIVPKNGYIFLSSAGLYSDFTLSFSIWTVASKVYTKEIIRLTDGKSKSPTVSFDINGNLNIIISENEQNSTLNFVAINHNTHRIFETEGWKDVMLDVEGNTLTVSIRSGGVQLMAKTTFQLETSYRPYKPAGKIYIKSNPLYMDSFNGVWKKILQIDGSEYTPTSSAIGHGTDELSDTEGVRKMADSEINKIQPDTMGYNYYKFIDKDTPGELILYVRTKEMFDDTAKAFGWTSNSKSLYDYCFLDHLQSISDCVWMNKDFGNGRFGTGMGRHCNRWYFDNEGIGPSCPYTSTSGTRCFSHDHDQSFCPRQSSNNQLREGVKIFKLDYRSKPSLADHFMEFFDTGNGQSYSSMQQTCISRDQRLCTYDEICPNGRFHEPTGGKQNYNDMWLPIDNGDWVQTGRGSGGWCQKLSGSSASYSPSNWNLTSVDVLHKKMFACCNTINNNNIKFFSVGYQNFGLRDIVYAPTTSASTNNFVYYSYNPETVVTHDNFIGFTSLHSNFRLNFQVKIAHKCNNAVGNCPLMRFMSGSTDKSPLVSIIPNSKRLCVAVLAECAYGRPITHEVCADHELADDAWQEVDVTYDNIRENKFVLRFPLDEYAKEISLSPNGETITGDICRIPSRKYGKVYITTPNNSTLQYWGASFTSPPLVRQITYASLAFHSDTHLKNFIYKPL